MFNDAVANGVEKQGDTFVRKFKKAAGGRLTAVEFGITMLGLGTAGVGVMMPLVERYDSNTVQAKAANDNIGMLSVCLFAMGGLVALCGISTDARQFRALRALISKTGLPIKWECASSMVFGLLLGYMTPAERKRVNALMHEMANRHVPVSRENQDKQMERYIDSLGRIVNGVIYRTPGLGETLTCIAENKYSDAVAVFRQEAVRQYNIQTEHLR